MLAAETFPSIALAEASIAEVKMYGQTDEINAFSDKAGWVREPSLDFTSKKNREKIFLKKNQSPPTHTIAFVRFALRNAQQKVIAFGTELKDNSAGLEFLLTSFIVPSIKAAPTKADNRLSTAPRMTCLSSFAQWIVGSTNGPVVSLRGLSHSRQSHRVSIGKKKPRPL